MEAQREAYEVMKTVLEDFVNQGQGLEQEPAKAPEDIHPDDRDLWLKFGGLRFPTPAQASQENYTICPPSSDEGSQDGSSAHEA